MANRKPYGPQTTDEDISTRFLFVNTDVRGNLLRADDTYLELVAPHDYPDRLKRLVGEFLAGALLLSETIKFDGRLLLQARTDGPIRMIMAEANNRHEVRALARMDESQPLEGDFPVLFYGGTLAVIVESARGESYQSLVPLNGANLAECLEHYFVQSEQLNTMIRLYADEQSAGGLLLQQLPPQRVPDKKLRDNQWEHLSILARTVTTSEMKELSHLDMIRRLFVEEDIEIYEPRGVRFACSCNERRLANSLITLGQDELASLFAETPILKLTCEFCQVVYEFDENRLLALVRGRQDTH